ncbi:BMC domain-containing protein [Desulfoluna spongiiphila]|uniref:Carboxysome shell and ethanolamine utilization microcompartment protein CcmL/EutN n=1 Tax=Desulfoluna spongiiphila TaxID=419481 RepID=A0A1G5JL73_9BACT|nr:BMC domain-containing protein [Desulfoluna spongiiphila]SCY89125.1 Carboxysome shell and ethanolamine utilization microcompartment protein CcmL/EutN [Desulfoluna spongiiphila]VVS91694.1 polyhedral organelle shell protein pdut [Desulfoluna spongiiphila]
MNYRTIGVVELNSIALGIETADEMSKAATVDLVMARPTCPGRYLVMVAGDTGSVKSSVAAGRELGGDLVIDWFVLPSVHPMVLPALSGATIVPRINALGVIETYTVAACIVAADAAAKAGQVDLIEIRFAAGLAGKSFVTMTGDVGSVKASVAAGVEGVGDSGPVYNHVVIPSPSDDLKAQLM